MSCTWVTDARRPSRESDAYLNLRIHSTLLIVKLAIVIGIHLQVVEAEFLLDSLLESLSLIKGKRIGLGNHGNDVDNIGQLLQNDNIDWFEATGTRRSAGNRSWMVGRILGKLTHGQMAG